MKLCAEAEYLWILWSWSNKQILFYDIYEVFSLPLEENCQLLNTSGRFTETEGQCWLQP